VRGVAVLFLHLLATVARLAGPGGARSVVAESVLLRHQLLILNRSRRRSPTIHLADRMVAGVCSQHVIAAAVDMKRRNPTWGCPQIALAFGIPVNKDVVRRILAMRYRPAPDSAGPSWLTVLGHAKDTRSETARRQSFEQRDACFP
jgi:putative transposase